ncbi:MAG: (Fe-S)-binding protein [Salinibacter sp.]
MSLLPSLRAAFDWLRTLLKNRYFWGGIGGLLLIGIGMYFLIDAVIMPAYTRHGVSVRVPDVGESGRAPLSQGMVATARERGKRVSGALALHLDAGRDVVTVEPSDLAMVRRAYHRLLPEQSAKRLDEHTYGAAEYLYGMLENGASVGDLPLVSGRERASAGELASVPDGGTAGEPVVYHRHCQGSTVGTAEYVEAVLSRAGYRVTTTDVECCGMAGSFGYKADYYEVSVDVGERLLDEVDRHEGRVVAEGASCLQQLRDLSDRPVSHPLELLAPGR